MDFTLKKGDSKAIFLILMAIILVFRIQLISALIVDSSSSGSLPTRFDLLDQRSNVSVPSQYPDDTVRVDPLDNFKKYRGGFDITNKHYWSSTIFTGIYGYALGILWLLCGILFLMFSLIKSFWYKNKLKSPQRLSKKSTCQNCYLWPILLAILFTFLAIVSSGVVLGGNSRFHSRAKTVVEIIIDTANEASQTIHNTTKAMKDIRDHLGASNGDNNDDVEAVSFLTSTSQELDNEAEDIRRQAKNNRGKIDKGLKIVFGVTTTIVSLNLMAVIALSVCGILRFKRALHMLVTLCWLLTVLCWLFFGMYFFLDRFACDTCTALENFQRNPYNNSLSSILPCDELVSAKSVLHDVSAGIHKLVDEVNANISLQQPSFAVSVCNPFSEPPEYRYQPENCPLASIKIGDIPKVLQVFSCSETENTTCGAGEFSMSNEDYRTIESYSSSIQNLLNAYPGMESLVECQSVKNAFSEILDLHCKQLKKFIRMVWASMAFLSMIMVILILLWTIRDHHETHQHFSGGVSVGPNSSLANELDLGTAKAVKDFSHSLV